MKMPVEDRTTSDTKGGCRIQIPWTLGKQVAATRTCSALRGHDHSPLVVDGLSGNARATWMMFS